MGIIDFFKDNTLDNEIANYEELSTKKPQDPSIKNSLGDLYLKKMSFEKAALYYREAIDLLLKQRLKDKAVALIKKSLSHNLLKITSLDEIAENLIDKGFTEDAVALYVGFAKQKLNTNRTLANDIFRKILQIAPENSEALSFFQKGKRLPESIEKGLKPLEIHAEGGSQGVHESIFKNPEYIPGEMHEGVQAKGFGSDNKPGFYPQKKLPQPSVAKKTEESVSSKIKDKFITVAKEKSHLENIIIQQNDIIRKFENENADISTFLNNLSEENKKLKEKLLDFDLLRNIEISELRKKIETLINENKKLLHEKDRVLKNLDRDQQNISFIDNRNIVDSLKKEKQELEDILQKTKAELEQKNAFLGNAGPLQEQDRSAVPGLEAENESLLVKNSSLQQELAEIESLMELRSGELKEIQGRYKAIQDERDELRAAVESSAQMLAAQNREKSLLEEEFAQKMLFYDTQAAEMKIDLDELTSSVEEKIKHIYELNDKVSQLSDALEQKDAEANREAPLLRADERSDLVAKIASLSKEIIDNDQLAANLSEDYMQEKSGLLAKIGDLENLNNRLEEENRRLLSEASDVQTRIAEYTRFCDEADSARQRLDEELLTLKQEFALKEYAMNEHLTQLQEVLIKKDALLDEHTDIYTKAEQDLSAVRSEHESALRNLERENSKLIEETSEAKARISEYTKFYEEADRRRQKLEEELSDLRQDGLKQEGLKEEIASLEMKNKELQELLELRAHGASEAALKLEDVSESGEKAESKQASALSRAAEAEQERDLLKAELLSINEKISYLELEKKASEQDLKEKIAYLQKMTDDIQLQHFLDMLEIKDNEIAEMKLNLADALSRIEPAGSKLSAGRNVGLETEQERDALKAELKALTEELSSLKDEKINVEAYLNNTITVRETEISRLKSDMEELRASSADSGEKEELAKRLEQFVLREDAMTDRISNLMSDLAHTEAMLSEKSKEALYEKEQLETRTNELEIIKQQLADHLGAQEEFEETKDKAAEYARLFEASEKERTELEEQLSEAFEKILDLENQYSSVLAARPSQEEIAELEKKSQAEVYELTKKLEMFQSDIEELKRQGHEKEKAMEVAASEKTAALKGISDMEAQQERTINDKEQEIILLKNKVSAVLERVNELEANLADSLRENTALRKKLLEKPWAAEHEAAPVLGSLKRGPASAQEAKDADIDTGVFSGQRRWLPYIAYSLIAVLVITTAGILMKQFTSNMGALHVGQSAVTEPLSYNELFDSLTQDKASEDVKFQATMLTEVLLNNENGGKDIPKYDFQRYHYFRVNINALKGGLSKEFIENPAASLALKDGEITANPADEVKKESAKVYYRRGEPVSVAFVIGFARNTGMSGQNRLELLFNRGGKEIRLAWDSQRLKAEKIIP